MIIALKKRWKFGGAEGGRKTHIEKELKVTAYRSDLNFYVGLRHFRNHSPRLAVKVAEFGGIVCPPHPKRQQVLELILAGSRGGPATWAWVLTQWHDEHLEKFFFFAVPN